jgi:hypothetical protein
MSKYGGSCRTQRFIQFVVVLVLILGSAMGTEGVSRTAFGEEPGTLTGETLAAGTGVVTSSYTTTAVCALGDTSTISFTAWGVATGPYTGTFRETGTVTLAPQTVTGFPTGPVLSFDSTFTIEAGSTTITGTKHLSAPSGTGSCLTAEVHGGADPQYFVEFRVPGVEYSATVHGPVGTWTEKGVASASGLDNRLSATSPQLLAKFGESFLTSTRDDQPATVVLSPTAAVNPVGTTHTVTASVGTASGQPVGRVAVRFTASGSVSTSGTCTTDQSGQCTFTYQGPDLPGTDVISAYVDRDNDGTQDAGEPGGQATKSWVLPVSTPGHVTGGGQIVWLDRSISFGLEAMSSSTGLQGQCRVVDHSTDTLIRCREITALVQTPTHATFFGVGTQNGQEITFRVDVDDLANPGAGRDTFTIQTDGGYLATGVLTEDNIEIHDQ